MPTERIHRRLRLGKSSLVFGLLVNSTASVAASVVSIDQGRIRGSRRWDPATYTGRLDPIREAFARARGVKPAMFSADSEGAYPTFNDARVIYTDLAMTADMAAT